MTTAVAWPVIKMHFIFESEHILNKPGFLVDNGKEVIDLMNYSKPSCGRQVDTIKLFLCQGHRAESRLEA